MDNSNQTEIQRLKELLKGHLKKKGYTYRDLARRLNVSENSVKRILNDDELSLSRLFKILDWLGLSLAELASMVGEGGRERFPELTEGQERFLAAHSDCAVILDDVMVGKPLDSIQKKYELTDASFQKYLRWLDRHKLIELLPNGHVRRLVKNFKIRRGGPLSQMIAGKLGDISKEYVENGMIFGNRPPKFSFHFNSPAPRFSWTPDWG